MKNKKLELKFLVKKFSELSLEELYAILALRDVVFTVEQKSAYLDVDGKDPKALHVLGFLNKELVAYSRIFKAGDYFEKASIGRVVIAKKVRKKNYGHFLVRESIAAVDHFFKTKQIQISAQKYLQNFYEKHGFIAFGKEYLEDEIPHIAMLKEK